ncbi:MAG: hypothetical protein NTW59_03830 [Candidatus Diapherotrites archaeon]|nr:hypothetical protein [Candidatus Diapherotrites archaeon]
MPKFTIKIGSLHLLAETTRENLATAKAVLGHLPIEGRVERWGEEIYFSVRFDMVEEHARQLCAPGEIGFWPDSPAIAIFFGKTPTSTGSTPKAYSPCNFFAKLLEPWNKAALNAVKSGTKITVGKAK